VKSGKDKSLIEEGQMDEVERTPEQEQQEKLGLRQAVRRLMEHLHFKVSHPARAGARSDSQRHSGLSATQLEELIRLSGTDPVLRSMLQRGSPLNRETYIAHNWGPDLPEDQGAEFELEIPEPFRRSPEGSVTSGMSGASSGPRPAPAARRPVPGGPPMRAPDGHMYVYAPHAGGLYQRVVMESPEGPATSDTRGASSGQPQAHIHQHLWQSDEELIRGLMRDHPGLTDAEARRDLEDFGGH
jgi:hypothetical protein